MTSKRLRTIVQVVPALNSGGVEKGTLEVAEALVKSGHRAIVVSAGGRMVPQLEALGAEHVTWDLGKKSLSSLLQYRRFRSWLRLNNVDVVHARSRMPAWVSWLAWRGMTKSERPRFVITVHGLNSVNIYSKVMTFGEVVIAVSNVVKSYVLDNYPDTNENKIIVIERGIDPKEFPYNYQPSAEWVTEWYKQYPQTKDRFLVTLPGRLTRLKGHHDLINLIADLADKIPEIHGLIVGAEDPKRMSYAKELYEMVESKGLSERITFTGFRSDMKEIYAVSNVVLSLSNKPESFGRTVVETVSLGRPVLGYDHGGVGETLSVIYPSGLVPLGDLSTLKDKVVELYTDPTVTLPSPNEYYTKTMMLEKTLAIYEAEC